MVEVVSDADNKRPLIYGVDMLRIWAALWVAFDHGAFLNVKTLLDGHFGAIRGVFGVLFSGSTAVVIFFVISGFCIHYPNVDKPVLDWKTFLVRRAMRISIPLLAIVAVTRLLGPAYVQSEGAVLWSLYCELIYYGLYPLLFVALKRIRLQYVVYGSAAISLILLISHTNYLRLWDFGIALTWLFCAPAWLLGARLAESIKPTNSRKLPGSIWLWRLAMIALGSFSTLLLFHTPARLHTMIGVPWTMLPVVGLAYFWIRDELLLFRPGPVNRIFETLGRASYSLYLVHKIGITALAGISGHMNSIVFWGAQITLITIATFAFYKIIEEPAHLLAKRVDFRKPLKPLSIAY